MSFSIGFIQNGGYIKGFAKDVVLSTSVVEVPALGIGPLSNGQAYDSGPSANNLRVNLESPLTVTLTVNLKNKTTGNSLGSFTISSGTLTGSFSGTLTTSQNDQIVLQLSLASGSEVLSGIQWYTF